MSRRMGKSSMRKTTLREIRQSFGRYMAILAIVALGVGFFSGLQAATPDMLESADAYLQEQELFDFRLVSTLGFDKDAAEYFEGEEGVRAAEGAYTSDVLVTVEDGEESVLTAHTLLEVQNQPVLTEGRMPENGQECVVDATAFSDADIGKTLKISVNNEEDTSDSFAHKEYTIVGLVNSPYYINYERGTTSLGTGKVAGFFYLLPEGFDTDYYTEIFVRLSDNALIYSDEYEQLADKAEAVLEPLTEEAANARYDRLLDEAQSEIADAEAELSEETAKAEEELADAKKELDDARTELEEGQRQIEDGEAQIAEARQEISERESQLADLRTQLEEARAQLEQGRASLSAMAGQAEGDAALAETLAGQ